MSRIFKLSGIVLVCIVGIFFVLGLIPDKGSIPQGFGGKFVTVDGAPIRVEQVGSGPDILFIHGLPAMLEVFDPLKNYLSPSCRLTLFDRPANGFSSAKGSKYTIEYNAHIALELIKKLNLKNVVVVGHSYGCSIAMAMALQDTVNIKALVLLGNQCMYYDEPVKKSMLGALFRIPVFGRGVAFLIGKTMGKKLMDETLRQAIFPSDPKLLGDLIEKAQTYWTTPKVLIDYSKEKRASPFSRKLMVPRYKNIKAKVVFIHGEQDRLVPVKHSVDASRLVERSTLILLKDDGHFPQYTRTDEIAEIILKEAQ
jgi:pimeloyl-ACP methyl ester carboxylesterase